MRNRLPRLWLSLLLFTFSIVIGCASSFEPRPPQEINFQERSQTQVDGNLRVTAAVLSADETEAVFGFALYKKGIQSIHLENGQILSFWRPLSLFSGQRGSMGVKPTGGFFRGRVD